MVMNTATAVAVPVAAPVRGHADGVVGPYVVGWALSSQGGPCRITVHDADGTVLGSGIGGRTRPDLGPLFGRTDLGFRILVADPGDRTAIHVRADGVELSNSPLPVGRERFDGEFAIRDGAAVGWVRARTAETVTPLVALYAEDGTLVGSAMAEHEPHPSDPHSARASFRVEIADAMFGIGEFALVARADGHSFARALGALRLVGYLDVLDNGRCAGWLVCPEAPRRQLRLEVVRDGVVAGRGRCTVERSDLREHYPIGWSNGFSIKLDPPPRASGPGLHTVSIRTVGGKASLLGGPHLSGDRYDFLVAARGLSRLVHETPPPAPLTDPERAVLQEVLRRHIAERRHGPDCDVIPAFATGSRRAERPVDVLIPIYKGIELTETCIRSVLGSVRAGDRVILVADCPPEAAMPAMLDRFRARDDIVLLPNDTNRGFVGSVNRGLGYSRGRDVLLLNSDTRMFPGGLEEMRAILHGADDVGTVTALSNNATIFSYPHPGLPAESLDDVAWDGVARTALAAGAGRSVDVPTGHGFCMLIRRELLDRIGDLNEDFGKGYGEENELCMRATDLGFRHAAALGVFVEHRESVSFGDDDRKRLIGENLPKLERMYPEYTRLVMGFEAADPLRVARWPIDAVRLRAAREAGTRFALVVRHWMGGGTDRAADDIGELVGYGGRTELRLRNNSDGTVRLDCTAPRLRATFLDGDGDELVRILDAAGVDLVVIHQLLGFGPGMVDTLGRWSRGRRGIAYMHDFYPICPRVTLIDAVDGYCGVQPSDVCDRCIAMDGGHPASRLDALTATEHRTLFARVLEGMHAVVAPSADAARHIATVMPGLPLRVVPHPEAPPAIVAPGRARDPGSIALLGAIGPHKGAGKLVELARTAALSHPALRFHVIGYTSVDDELAKLPNVSVTGKYKPDELPGLIEASRATVALFLHVWPETYSYTLSEAVGAGLLPVVPDIGAPAERVRATGWGTVYSFPAGSRELLDLLADAGRTGTGDVPAAARGGTESSIPMLAELFGTPDAGTMPVAASTIATPETGTAETGTAGMRPEPPGRLPIPSRRRTVAARGGAAAC